MAKEPKRNVYVGHRYVPKIMGEWDKQETYEGLSIVTNEGTSYTSKKRVPAGIDILNTDYWVVTGNYNAQVDQYRQEVINMGEYVNDEVEDLTELVHDTLDSKADKSDLIDTDKNIDNVKNNLDIVRKIVEPSMTLEEIQTILNDYNNIYFDKGLYEFSAIKLDGETHGLFNIYNNNNIILHPEAHIKIKNAEEYGYGFTNRSAVFYFKQVNDVYIEGGIIEGDRDEHTEEDGEHGYGLLVLGGNNITIKNVFSKNCFGDGFAVQKYGQENIARNVNLLRCKAYNNRRQGLTIGHVENLLIRDCIFEKTNGTAPESGIDIEPSGRGYIRKITIDNCVFKDNVKAGLIIDLSNMFDSNYENQNKDEFFDLKVNNCLFENTGQSIRYTTRPTSNGTGFYHGSIKVDNCTFSKVNSAAIRIYTLYKNKHPDIFIENCFFEGIKKDYVPVIHAHTSSSMNEDEYGGLYVKNIVVSNFSDRQGHLNSIITINAENDNKPYKFILDGFTNKDSDFPIIRNVYWGAGEGFVKYHSIPKVLNSESFKGNRKLPFYNGVLINSDSSMKLPDPKLYPLRKFNFIREVGFRISYENNVSENRKTYSYGEETETVQLKKNTINTLISDGEKAWFLNEGLN